MTYQNSTSNKLVPCLWFHPDGGQMEEIINYYKSIFGDNFKEGKVSSLGETPSGNTEICEVYIFDKKYSFLTTAIKHHSFTDAFAFAIQCVDQEEIDKFWNYFTKEGEAMQCGWCSDKYGLRWQILPENLAQLMTRPDSFQIMMSQKKIIIEDYLK